MQNQQQQERYNLFPEAADLFSQEDAALALAVSPIRLAELTAAGIVAATPDGSVTLAEVQRCQADPKVRPSRRYIKPQPGRQEAQEAALLALALQWHNVATMLMPIHNLPPDTWRSIAPALIGAMQTVGLPLQL